MGGGKATASRTGRGVLRAPRLGPVFFGRWLPGLRVVASWLAGADRMRWRRFLLWNALGGISWAITIGTVAYVLGQAASGSLGAIGFAGLAIAALVYLASRIRRRYGHPRQSSGGADRYARR
jgi:membrane protein DedA with SNARE-associated domain